MNIWPVKINISGPPGWLQGPFQILSLHQETRLIHTQRLLTLFEACDYTTQQTNEHKGLFQTFYTSTPRILILDRTLYKALCARLRGRPRTSMRPCQTMYLCGGFMGETIYSWGFMGRRPQTASWSCVRAHDLVEAIWTRQGFVGRRVGAARLCGPRHARGSFVGGRVRAPRPCGSRRARRGFVGNVCG